MDSIVYFFNDDQGLFRRTEQYSPHRKYPQRTVRQQRSVYFLLLIAERLVQAHHNIAAFC